MELLTLQKLLKVLNGKIIKGKRNIPIHNVSIYNDKKITDYTLIFDQKYKSINLPPQVNSCAIVTQNPSKFLNIFGDYTIIYVESVYASYWNFIKHYRSLFDIPVIGVTGTCGKTTTKEMIKWILEKDAKITSTYMSQNGLAWNLRYLTSIDSKTKAAVFEMGVGAPGHLMYSARYFQPNIGIITSIGTDHTLGFKTQERYVREKTKMLQCLKNKGVLILNNDDETIRKIDLSNYKGMVIYYGVDHKAHFRASHIQYVENGMSFTLHFRKKKFKCFVPGYGKHNVYNALAALAATRKIGVPIREAINRLASFKQVKSHLQFQNGLNNSTIIDDTWNTNPTSIKAALEVLQNVSAGRSTVAVLGDIEELGELSVKEHRKIGSMVVSHGIDKLITVGPHARHIAIRALELGMKKENVIMLKDQQHLYPVLNKHTDSNTLVLIKASMRKSFQTVLNRLIAN